MAAFQDGAGSRYREALGQAYASLNPLYLKPRYGDFFHHCNNSSTGWLIRALLANSRAEASGCRQLRDLQAREGVTEEVERGLDRHVRDEARHSRVFLRLARAAGGEDEDLLSRLEQATPHVPFAPNPAMPQRPITSEGLLDSLIQINIAEIRTRAHLRLLSAALDERHAATDGALQALGADECRHIGYTAELIELIGSACDRALVTEMYTRRLRDFDEITIMQTDRAVQAMNADQFTDPRSW